MGKRDREGQPGSFGYVRVPQLDTAKAVAWEKPNGELRMFDRMFPPIVVMFGDVEWRGVANWAHDYELERRIEKSNT